MNDLNDIFGDMSGYGTDICTNHDLKSMAVIERDMVVSGLKDDPHEIPAVFGIVGYDLGDPKKDWYVIHEDVDTDIPKAIFFKVLAGKMVYDNIVPLALLIRFEHWQVEASSEEEADAMLSGKDSLEDVPGRQEGLSIVVARRDKYGYGLFYKIERVEDNRIVLLPTGQGFFSGDSDVSTYNRPHEEFFETYDMLMERRRDKGTG